MAVVCQYFLRGKCNFGDKCRNLHPVDASGKPAVSNAFTLESIQRDFTPHTEKPLWPLSVYGPAKNQPTVISGWDESFEEFRVRAVQATKNNDLNSYLKYEADRISAAEQFYANALSNAASVLKAATENDGNPSPQPYDPSKAPQSPFGASSTGGSAFGQSSFGQTGFGSGSSFSQPSTGNSAFGTKPVFGQPTSAFGQPTQPTSAFGQPSAFGQASTSPVIRPATGAFGGSTSTGAFGGSGSSGGAFSAFAGKPATFGSNATPTNPSGSVFGQSSFSNNNTTSPFGQTSTTSAFGTPAPAASAFGGNSAFGGSNATGSAFGNSSSPSTGAFGGSVPATTSAFGAPAPAPSAFGSSSGPFGGSSISNSSPSPFGSTTATGSAFGTPATTATTTSAFGTTSNPGGAPASSAFGNPAPAASAFGNPAPVAGAFGLTSTPGSAFGSSTTGAFGNASSGSGAFGNTSNAFGGSTTTTASPFGASVPTQTSAFGTPASAQSAFGTSAPITSAFGTNNASASPFGANTTTTAAASKGGITGTLTPASIASAPSVYQAGVNPYDANLPKNYLELLPESAKATFAKDMFECGDIPEWIPPMEMR